MVKKPAKTQIVISAIPRQLVKEIERIAVADHRTRSSQTVLLLQEILEIRRERQPAEATSQ